MGPLFTCQTGTLQALWHRGEYLEGVASRVENITNKVNLAMSGIQQQRQQKKNKIKNSHHTKKKENTAPSKEKSQSIERGTELTWVLELAHKGIKIVTNTLFYILKRLGT